MVSKDVTVCNAQEFVTSPDGAVKVTVGVKSKQAFYEVSFHPRVWVFFSLMVRQEPMRGWGL